MAGKLRREEEEKRVERETEEGEMERIELILIFYQQSIASLLPFQKFICYCTIFLVQKLNKELIYFFKFQNLESVEHIGDLYCFIDDIIFYVHYHTKIFSSNNMCWFVIYTLQFFHTTFYYRNIGAAYSHPDLPLLSFKQSMGKV